MERVIIPLLFIEIIQWEAISQAILIHPIMQQLRSSYSNVLSIFETGDFRFQISDSEMA